ncbi:MAG: beta-lactamase family protein [Epsilonproteobacteria bacterium]|nr:beta-lactamase family protein [Campylobacterota bacterium]
MHIQKIVLIILVTFLVGCGGSSDTQKTDSLAKDEYREVARYMNSYILAEMDKNEIVGLSIALVDDQEIVWQKGFGYADKANEIEATPQTRYRAGSITKLFNGMATMKLVEEGKMDIDQPLVNYLPEFSIKSRFGSTDMITPRNIMTHHSRLPGNWVDKMFAEEPHGYYELVSQIKESYVAYAPNTILSYSNLGISLLGHAVEKTSGELYNHYLARVLLTPLGMQDSDLEMELLGSFASKAYIERKEVREYPLGDIPAGALNTTVGDLSRLAMMVNNQGQIDGQQVLQAESLTQMFTVQNSDIVLDLGLKIGLAWFIDTDILVNNEPVYSHGGATIAHRASFMVAPESKLGVIVLANSAEANSEEIASTLLKKAWEHKTGKKIQPHIVQEVVSNDFEPEGTYVSVMLGGKIDITKESNISFTINTFGGTIPMQKNVNGTYGSLYLEDVEFYTKEVEGEEIIVARQGSTESIAAVKVVAPETISSVWQSRVGTYRIINQIEPESMQLGDVRVFMDDGFLVVSFDAQETASMNVLTIINDTEAVLAGLGRSQRETLVIKDGVVLYQGLQFERVE